MLDLGLTRKHPWSLPDRALAQGFDTTISCLVLRFNFQFETEDDPNTTGRGAMSLNNPLANPADSAVYYDSVRHWIDPPPHDSLYFDAHMRSLSRYWETVSEQRISLSWEIFPPKRDSVYVLPHPMSYYGKCEPESVIVGLERYFIDCVQLADSMSPEINFSNYQSIFLFHAGSDRQNDIGFPETCNDLFTGFILFGDSLAVDSGNHYVRTALMMPETASQDNRATALNAVMAHEFGHQLGLVDLYSTRTFITQLGDFSLMDNNGFGTGLDLGFDVGRVFGAIPLYPMAWSRAHLGYVDVHDFRYGTDIRLAAAEMVSDSIKVARIPITENEYYLLENRLVDIDGIETGLRADSATNVIQGPVEIFREPGGQPFFGEYTSEYDVLMPGSGVLIFHVDEGVFSLDYDGDGVLNFEDNQLQWDPDRKFITLIEGDGIVHFGGFYRSGWGRPVDMYRDDRNSSFTPNTRPPAIDNSGNNTHIHITNISRQADTVGLEIIYDERWIQFDVRTEKLVPGFPVRAGRPVFQFSPITDDINRDGTDEILVVSNDLLSVMTSEGDNFLRSIDSTITAPLYYDTALSSIDTGAPYPVPLYAREASTITAGPVTGDFGQTTADKLVAVGVATGSGGGRVSTYRPTDDNNDGQADFAGSFFTSGTPLALIFGNSLFALTDKGNVYRQDSPTGSTEQFGPFDHDEYHGLCRPGEALVLMAGDDEYTTLYAIGEPYADTVTVPGYYRFGPIAVDVDRDDIPEIVGISPDGKIILVSLETTPTSAEFSVLRQRETGAEVTTNPIAADIDLDGYPDIIAGGKNRIYAFNYDLALLTDFPILVQENANDEAISAPSVADIERGGPPEILFPTLSGNIFSYGQEISFGFPLSAGEFGFGSPLVLNDSAGGKVGYLGADGWFYLWQVDADTVRDFWPMGGGDPSGSLSFNSAKLGTIRQFTDLLPAGRFYNYPNPVVDGYTRIRYFLGQDARQVNLTMYDLSGLEIESFTGPTTGGIDNEIEWSCSHVTPGVYRCRIEVDFGSETRTDFTDIAVIR